MFDKEWLEVFASNLIYWLQQSDMTQRDLAQRTGLSEASISNYIKKKQAPGFNAIRSIANAFGIQIEDLTG